MKVPKYGDVSVRDLSRELGFSSYGSAQRNLLKAEEKRSLIADGRIEGWIVLDEREVWNKMPDELKDAFEDWMENNEKVAISPEKLDTLKKRDRKGEIVHVYLNVFENCWTKCIPITF